MTLYFGLNWAGWTLFVLYLFNVIIIPTKIGKDMGKHTIFSWFITILLMILLMIALKII